jgi:hypothetical protein
MNLIYANSKQYIESMLKYARFTNVYRKSVSPCGLKNPLLALGLSCKN